MPTFYTLDRLSTLREGLDVTLTLHSDVTPPELAEHAREMWPQGLSTHGARFFLGNMTEQEDVTSARIDAYFEAVRAAYYPHRPSRYTSMFAVPSLDDARTLRQKLKPSVGPIYEVTSELWFKADMRLLKVGSVLVQSFFAHLYWRGEPHPSTETLPEWEVLLELPQTIGRRVEDAPSAAQQCSSLAATANCE